MTKLKYHYRGQQKAEHVLIAERALGRALPKCAEVHHWNGDGKDNRPSNLVVCPSHSYHALLHARARALDACGNADWRPCNYCHQYDSTGNMIARYRPGRPNGHFWHRECSIEANRQRRANAKPQ